MERILIFIERATNGYVVEIKDKKNEIEYTFVALRYQEIVEHVENLFMGKEVT